tara:strand:+ start:12308 stop:12454 length:147 start_codon:yes stop_codon:yes gene_type:complete
MTENNSTFVNPNAKKINSNSNEKQYTQNGQQNIGSKNNDRKKPNNDKT